MVVAKKFGLDELERYTDEVGFKNGDVRTIKGVLAIVGIPNSVVAEARDAIASADVKIAELQALKTTLEGEDAEDEAKTKGEVARLQADRKARRDDYRVRISAASDNVKPQNSEIKKLETILKKFS